MKLKSMALNDHILPVAHPNSFDELPETWRLLGLTREQPVIVMVGGAGGMSKDDITKVHLFFEKYLVPFVQRKKVAVVEGGTDSGVMAAIGQARKSARADFPLIGIVARDIETVEAMLEPNHTHFIFCPGNNWGDESKWIAAAASTLSGSQPSAAILINGGKITWEDARLNIQYGRQVLIAEGSGRAADVIATTSTGRASDPQAISLLRTRKVHVANFFKKPEYFIEKLDGLMK